VKIVLRNISKCYGRHSARKVVLEKVNLDLAPGTWLSVVGTSGSGKSTLLNIIAGLMDPDSGSIEVDGFCRGRERLQLVSYMLQDFPLYPSIDVRKNLQHAGKIGKQRGVPEFEELVDKFKLGLLLNQLPSQLSGGERQRCALVRTMLLGRPVVLLDEPFSNMDVILRKELRRYLRKLQLMQGTTVILVTHDQEDAVSTSDLVGFLDGGCLVQVDAPPRVFRHPASLRVATNFGDVGMVLFPVTLLSSLGFIQQENASNFHLVGIRETDFELNGVTGQGAWQCNVLGHEFLGSRIRIFLAYRGNTFAVVTNDSSLAERSELYVMPKMHLGVFFNEDPVSKLDDSDISN
jgi:ABC-type sugar transport system ATPase subunit